MLNYYVARTITFLITGMAALPLESETLYVTVYGPSTAVLTADELMAMLLGGMVPSWLCTWM